MPAWLQERGEDLLLQARVVARSTRAGFGEVRSGRMRIHVNQAPADGKANAALVRLVAERFAVPRSAVSILTGHHTRDKTLLIARPGTRPPLPG